MYEIIKNKIQDLISKTHSQKTPNSRVLKPYLQYKIEVAYSDPTHWKQPFHMCCDEQTRNLPAIAKKRARTLDIAGKNNNFEELVYSGKSEASETAVETCFSPEQNLVRTLEKGRGEFPFIFKCSFSGLTSLSGLFHLFCVSGDVY